MSSSVQQTEPLSKPAQDLLEQYKHYREDGIVDIMEPISSQPEPEPEPNTTTNQTQNKPKNTTKNATEIAEKIMKNHKTKRSTIITKLHSDPQTKKASADTIGGCSDSWWNKMIHDEDKFVTDYKHKVHNIATMQKYETLKDPSPFNTDNHMNLQQEWGDYLWKESIQKQAQYLDKIDPKQSKQKSKKQKKVKFASDLVTKEASSENVTEDIDTKPSSPKITPKEPIKAIKSAKQKKKQQYGNLVGFFNKKKNKKKKIANTDTKVNNPYLDNALMKGIKDFTPHKNQVFEKKFNHKNKGKQDITHAQSTVIASDEFKSMIIPSEFKPKDNVSEKDITKEENTQPKAFNGQVFERKPPDIAYVSYVVDADDGSKQQTQSVFNSKLKEIEPQCLPAITQPKESLFRKRIEMNDTLYELEDETTADIIEKYPMIITDTNEAKCDTKKVRFVDNLVTKQLVIDDGDKYEEKEDICLLFLDVDGVLNCSYSPSLSRVHILRLKTILNRTANCKICISSSWRVYKHTRLQLLNGLEQLGRINVNERVIGDTPKLRKNALRCRPEEIQQYLDKDEYLNNNYNVLQWCAIDDIPLDTINATYNGFIKDHFVRTNANKGITDHDVERVIYILNGMDTISTMKRLESVLENDESNMRIQVMDNKGKKEEIKILFLDVDGVLNYSDFDDEGVNGALSMEHLVRLKRIIDKTECRIVLSTSWRRIPTAKEQLLRQFSSRIGLDVGTCVIGDTPVLGSQMKKSVEIYQYLESVKDMYEIVSWIAIDDMPLDKIGTKQIKQIFKDHFVKTDVEIGLTDENVLSAISLLNVHELD